jgi:CBS domain-containing protein
MALVSEVLARKGGQVHTIHHDATVHEAIERMVRQNIGSLIVLEGKAVAGIFTERDFLRRVALPGLDPRSTPIGRVMTDKVIGVDPDRTVAQCMAMMTKARIRHLPVVDGTGLIGMLSIGDLVKHVSDEQQVELKHLHAYITGQNS